MPTVLCYGDSNTWGCVPQSDPAQSSRFAPEDRWPGIASKILGPGWTLIEEGLPGRTTLHDDPIEGAHKNGLTYLVPCLESHRPLDIVAIMLGTNDLKARFGLPAQDVADSVGVLVHRVAVTLREFGPEPKVLVICPPPILETGCFAEMFAGGGVRSQRLAPLYRCIAENHGAAYLDAGSVIASSPLDGIHFDRAAHRALGEAVAEELRRLSAP